MKFDYKILIFLGLACACFYLYREQYYLRLNISKVESKVSNYEKTIVSLENSIATINKNINKLVLIINKKPKVRRIK
jgi:cell division protein FtsL